MNPTLQEIIDQLHAKRSGDRWSARCPAHDDRSPSLSIKQGDGGRILLHCHAGCSIKNIVEAMGLKMADLFDDDGGNGKAGGDRRIVAVYPYCDADGTLLYESVRFIPKDFRQRRPDGRGGYVWNLQGVTRILYRLPELIAADEARTVFIVEGEKDADRLVKAGLLATTNVFGAGKWRDDYNHHLQGRNVIVIADKDAPGRDHAHKVAASLNGVAASVKVLELPGEAVKDASDWFSAGGTVEQLVKLVGEAPVFDPEVEPASTVEQQTPQRPVMPAPNRINDAAFHGLAGEIVRKIEPHTEADPAALLVHLLIAVGNIVGRGAYILAGGVKHYANLFGVMVGDTAKGRKGTSAANVNHVIQQAAPDWIDDHQQNGLSSGEGLLWAVRDPIKKRVPVKKDGRHTGEYDEVEEDPGISDKRLLVMEGEFAQTLKVMAREGNTLSPIIRNAWDGAHKLQSMTKNSPAKATDAHISIVGHITLDELRPSLAGTAELFNGFANRFLWVYTRRRKLLPNGGQLHTLDFSAEVQRLTAAIEFGREDHFLSLDADAQIVWDTLYRDLEIEHRGVFGAVTARASAQTLRLAMIYAILDCSPWISPVHLQAAHAVWRYCEQTVAYIFGGPRPDANDPLAELVAWIVSRGGRCTSRDLVRNLNRYRGKSDQADADLQKLVDDGRGRWELSNPAATGGRQNKTFVLTTDTDETPTGATENEPFVGVGTVGGTENAATDEEGWVAA